MKAIKGSILVTSVALFVVPIAVQSQRITRISWPKKQGVYVATSSETIPLFPRALSGFRPTGNKDFWDRPFTLKGSIRIGEGNGWEGIPDFPMTMNHCSDGVFMIRWRSADPSIRIGNALGYRYSNAIWSAMTGSFGYMQGTNCEEPMFKFGRAKPNGSNLVDIYYELKFWRAAP